MVAGLPAYDVEHAVAIQSHMYSADYLIETTPKISLCILGVFGLHFIRNFMHQKIFHRLALRFGIKDQQILSRFCETAFYAFYYTFSSCFGLFVMMYVEEWAFYPTLNMWRGWPFHELKLTTEAYYLTGLTFYIHGLFSLFFVDKRRKDFMEYLIHHVITIFLIFGSYYSRIHRYGMTVLLLHDVGDAILYTVKLVKYVGKEPWTTIGFAIFAVTFVYTRLVFFPFTIIYSVCVEAPIVMTETPHIPFIYPMVYTLLGLQCLHVVWFTFLVKAIVGFIKGKGVEDSRSDDEVDNSNEESSESKSATVTATKSKKSD